MLGAVECVVLSSVFIRYIFLPCAHETAQVGREKRPCLHLSVGGYT
jgi:hypothetical protein